MEFVHNIPLDEYSSDSLVLAPYEAANAMIQGLQKKGVIKIRYDLKWWLKPHLLFHEFLHYIISKTRFKFCKLAFNFFLDYSDAFLKPSCKTILFGFTVYPWNFSILEVLRGLKWEYEKILIGHYPE